MKKIVGRPYDPKVAEKFAKEDTPLDTFMTAKNLLIGHTCENCFGKYNASSFSRIKCIDLSRGRNSCSLWHKYRVK